MTFRVQTFNVCRLPSLLGLLAILSGCSSGSNNGNSGAALPGSPDPVGTLAGAPDPSGTATGTVPVLPGVVPSVPGDVVRRLSRAELDNTLRDLLGDTSSAAARSLAEDEYTPFDNDAGRQSASSALIETLEAMATDVARRVLGDATLRAKLVPCVPNGVADSACFRQVVKGLGRRAFRRTFSDTEVDHYMPILTLVQTEGPAVGATFDTAVELSIRSFVQDPEFLYRIEIGAPAATPGSVTLTGFEAATRLSYLIWGSMPDEPLLTAAENAQLADGVGRKTEALRLLNDPRAKSQAYRFHAMWLGYRAIPQAPALAAAFVSETNRLIDRAAFESGSYLTLFSSKETYLDTSLATHYGLSAPAGGAAWVMYPDASQRAGILSQGSVLSAFSKFSDTSPTQRGILVRTRLMCEDIPPPPAVVDVDKAPTSATSNCKIDRYAAHRETASCAACHAGMDLIGFGLENFDMAGRYRDHDDGHPECAISGQGTVPVLGNFSGPKELSEKLITAQKVEMCMVQHFNAFASGRARHPEDLALLTPLVERFRQGGFSFKDLMLDYVGSTDFGSKREVAP